MSITGMTQSEVMEAFRLYDARQQEKQQTTFKGVLWLASLANPMQQIAVNVTPFSTLPDHFERQQAITLYVYTLSLDFGVDVREFWPASQAGATKAEAEVQAQKAKGKGFGRMLSSFEREFNWNVLPQGLEFAFDQKDSEDDLIRESIRARVIENVRRLWEPNPVAGEGIVTTEEARRMLVEAQVVPDWLAPTEEVTAYGTENEPEPEEPIPAPPVEKAVDAEIVRLMRKAALSPGEDLVAINRRGDVVTVKSARSYYRSACLAQRAERGSKAKGVEKDPLDRERRKAERRLTKALYAFFAGQFARVQEALETGRLELIAEQQRRRELSAIKQQWNLDLALDWNAEQQALSVSIGDLLQQIAGEALENIKKHYSKLGGRTRAERGVRTSWEVWDQAAVEQAQKYGYDLIQQISDSTRKQIGETISQWIESPDDFQVLVEKIHRIIPGNPFFPRIRDRAQVIAATEVTRVYADAQVAGLKAAGLKNLRWRVAEDELVCDVCRPLGMANEGEGAVGTVDGGFVHPETGMVIKRPPAHVNCRCWIAEDTEELNALLAQMPQPTEKSGQPG